MQEKKDFLYYLELALPIITVILTVVAGAIPNLFEIRDKTTKKFTTWGKFFFGITISLFFITVFQVPYSSYKSDKKESEKLLMEKANNEIITTGIAEGVKATTDTIALAFRHQGINLDSLKLAVKNLLADSTRKTSQIINNNSNTIGAAPSLDFRMDEPIEFVSSSAMTAQYIFHVECLNSRIEKVNYEISAFTQSVNGKINSRESKLKFAFPYLGEGIYHIPITIYGDPFYRNLAFLYIKFTSTFSDPRNDKLYKIVSYKQYDIANKKTLIPLPVDIELMESFIK